MFNRLTILLVALAAATGILFAAPAPSDAAGGTVDFDGSGWGHGVGMSQYGAYGRAAEGQSYVDILEAYYTGATVGQLGVDTSDVALIDVNVGSDVTGTTLTVSNGPGTQTGMVFTRLETDGTTQTATLFSGDSAVVTDTTPEIGGTHGCEITLSISGVPTTWDVGSCDIDVALVDGATSPGHLVTATDCRRPSDCTFGWGVALKLVDNGSAQRTQKDTVGCPDCPPYQGFDIVVELSVDDYVRGIAEVPYSWPMEALKTQAVAARSYAASFALDSHLDEGCFCDVKNDSSWQVYAGWIGDRTGDDRWIDASDATAGQVMAHPAGASTGGIVRTYYSSSNGGASEREQDQWPGGTIWPYYDSVDDPWSLTSANPRRAWTFTESADEIVDRVWGTSSTLDLISVEVIDRNVSGSAKTVRFVGAANDGSFSTQDRTSGTVRGWFGMYSRYFSVDDDGLGPVGFTDIDGNIHAANIEYLNQLGAALACDDGPTSFCPEDPMRREDLAAFMVRALELPPSTTDYFVDDDGLEFEADINALMEAGITRGCNPPDNDRYCPDNTVTRGQTAAFIVRAWALTDVGKGDWFVDDDDSVFEGDIDKLATVGITRGCNPPSNDRYCPDTKLTRAQMSSFLARALRDLGIP